MLEVLTDPKSASNWCSLQRSKGRSVGFVATMGGLHAGHLALVKRSVSENDVTCASIFVNPLQFNDPTDFEKYPRNMQSDYNKLESAGCNMVFSGTSTEMFPEASSLEIVEILDPGPNARGLEGEYRPGHLEGVCTVVNRLFQFVGACRAYFGTKDFQQLLVVQELAKNMGYPVVVPCPTVRESNGLAMSSRNEHLSHSDFKKAGQIYLALLEAKKIWDSGERSCDKIRKGMQKILRNSSLLVEYADLRDPTNWQADSPTGELKRAVALIAVQVSGIRLIDNLILD